MRHFILSAAAAVFLLPTAAVEAQHYNHRGGYGAHGYGHGHSQQYYSSWGHGRSRYTRPGILDNKQAQVVGSINVGPVGFGLGNYGYGAPGFGYGAPGLAYGGYSPYGYGGFGSVGYGYPAVGNFGYSVGPTIGGAGVYIPGLNYGIGPAPFPNYGPNVYYGNGLGYGYQVDLPPVTVTETAIVPPGSPDVARRLKAQARAGLQLGPAPIDETESVVVRKYIPPSSAAAKLKSLRHQHHGDLHLLELDYSQAYADYVKAIQSAEDRWEPYFRAGVALAGAGQFDRAVEQMLTAWTLQPMLASDGPFLGELLSEEHKLGQTLMKQRVADWVREDYRDPPRLFLMGVLLHFDGEPDKAKVLFSTAEKLATLYQNEELAAASASFLAVEAPRVNVAAPVEVGQPLPPLPEPVDPEVPVIEDNGAIPNVLDGPPLFLPPLPE